MTAWLSVLVPLLVMFFALGMERVESRLRETSVRQDELDELLEQPRPDEVRALFRSGTNRALEMFRLRHRDAAADARPAAARCLPDRSGTTPVRRVNPSAEVCDRCTTQRRRNP